MMEDIEKVHHGEDHNDVQDNSQVHGAAHSKPSNSLSENDNTEDKVDFQESDVPHDQFIQNGATTLVILPQGVPYPLQSAISQTDNTGPTIATNMAEKDTDHFKLNRLDRPNPSRSLKKMT